MREMLRHDVGFLEAPVVGKPWQRDLDYGIEPLHDTTEFGTVIVRFKVLFSHNIDLDY